MKSPSGTLREVVDVQHAYVKEGAKKPHYRQYVTFKKIVKSGYNNELTVYITSDLYNWKLVKA